MFIFIPNIYVHEILIVIFIFSPLFFQTIVPKIDQAPVATYASLIAVCIFNSEHKKLLLEDIYNFVENYRCLIPIDTHPNWKNSVRHNLSLRKCFKKVARHSETGKVLSAYWAMDDTCLPKAAEDAVIRMKQGLSPLKDYNTVQFDSTPHATNDAIILDRQIAIAQQMQQQQQIQVVPTANLANQSHGSQAKKNQISTVKKERKRRQSDFPTFGDDDDDDNETVDDIHDGFEHDQDDVSTTTTTSSHSNVYTNTLHHLNMFSTPPRVQSSVVPDSSNASPFETGFHFNNNSHGDRITSNKAMISTPYNNNNNIRARMPFGHITNNCSNENSNNYCHENKRINLHTVSDPYSHHFVTLADGELDTLLKTCGIVEGDSTYKNISSDDLLRNSSPNEFRNINFLH